MTDNARKELPAYNLIDKPWLRVRLMNGHIAALGLIEVFERAHEIVTIAETEPPTFVAEYRTLLAILHRAATQSFGTWKTEDRAEWYKNGLPLHAIQNYLEHWRERFWLFHETHPFIQAAVLDETDKTRNKQKPWTQMSLGNSNGNTPVVFDHSFDISPTAITPDRAITTLLGFLQFTPGGLVQVFRSSDKAGPLANTAAVIAMGDNLAETLALNLHTAPSSQSNQDSDLPAWESAPLALSQLSGDPVFATGPNDRYTRQSRAVLLLREDNGNVRWVRYAAGLALAEHQSRPDPMASFRAGNKGPVRLTFREGRATWRDLPAIVPGPNENDENQRSATVMKYAARLHEQLGSGIKKYQPIIVTGLASDQAKLLRWRMDQITLPANLISNTEIAQELKEKIATAENLYQSLRGIAFGMITEMLPDTSKEDKTNKANGILNASPLNSTYFATAERGLPDLMDCISAGQLEVSDQLWANILRNAVLTAWQNLMTEIGYTPRLLRAEAYYRPGLLNLFNKYEIQFEKETNQNKTNELTKAGEAS